MRTEDLVAELAAQAGPPPDVDAAWEALLANDRRRTRRQRGAGAAIAAAVIVGAVTVVATWPSTHHASDAKVASSTPSAGPTTSIPAVAVPDGWHEVRAPDAGVALAIPVDWRKFESLPSTSTSAVPLLTVGRASEELGSWLNTGCSANPGTDTPRQTGVWLTLYEYPSSMATAHLVDPVLGDAFVDGDQPFGQIAVPRPTDFTATNEASPGSVACSPNGYSFKDQFFTDRGRVFVARAVTTGEVVDKYAQLTPREILNTLQVDASAASPVPAPATTTALQAAQDAPPCTAADFEFAGNGTSLPGSALLRFFNRGAACRLHTAPLLEGRLADGSWVEIPTQSTGLEPVSAAPWTGIAEHSGAAIVIGMRRIEATAFTDGQCPEGELPHQHFDLLRITLTKDGSTLDLPNTPFDLGGCRIDLTEFGYDSTDE
jgi:hypothetical protein